MLGRFGRLGPLGRRVPWDFGSRRRGERFLVLVRHGEAAAGWGDDPDPGLSDLGREQAAAAADDLAGLGPLPVVTSPLRRCRETAAPLEERWGSTARAEPGVGEIVAPASSSGLDARAAWLATALAGSWRDLGAEHHAWRTSVLDALRALREDTVVVSHFVALNVAVGEATGDERVTCFRPAHASRTFLKLDTDDRFGLVSLGATGTRQVL